MNLKDFVFSLNKDAGTPMPNGWSTITDETALARQVIKKLDEFLFQTTDDDSIVNIKGEVYRYFSDFQKYWQANQAEIINAQVNRNQAKVVAHALHEAHEIYGESIFRDTRDTHGLSKKAIAQARFFTANQDFRKPPEDQFGKYLEDDTQFDARNIYDSPSDFLSFLGMSDQSQNDKRLDYAKNAAHFLMERKINAFLIASYFKNDAEKIRDGFLENVGMGYGRKKTDMFIRDMVEFGVWENLSNLDVIDVASDRNTMKLALRTQVLQTDIPLLSSFLDIFGYQYGYIDKTCAAAWRLVWEEWKSNNPETAPVAPCMMDFLLYRIGRQYCDDKLVEFVCENGHRFYHFGAMLKKCRQCRSNLTAVKRFIPCQVHAEQLPRDEERQLRLKETNLLRTFDGVCIFESACLPKTEMFKKLSPPKAISIIGRTGWTESYANKDEGGGGMMG